MSIKKGKKQVYKVGQTVRVVQCMDKEYVGKIGTIAFLFRNGGIDVDLGDGLLVIASKVSPLKPKKSKKKKCNHLYDLYGKSNLCVYCRKPKPKKSIKKKETKVQELERRIKALEAHRCNPTPTYYPNSTPTQPYGLQQNQPTRCRWCGLEVSLCRGHAIG